MMDLENRYTPKFYTPISTYILQKAFVNLTFYRYPLCAVVRSL